VNYDRETVLAIVERSVRALMTITGEAWKVGPIVEALHGDDVKFIDDPDGEFVMVEVPGYLAPQMVYRSLWETP
jgi:hypothetical protein